MAHELHTNDLNKANTSYGVLKGSLLTKNFKIINKPPYRPTFEPTNPHIVGAVPFESGVAGVSPQATRTESLTNPKKKGLGGAPIRRSNDKQENL